MEGTRSPPSAASPSPPAAASPSASPFMFRCCSAVGPSTPSPRARAALAPAVEDGWRGPCSEESVHEAFVGIMSGMLVLFVRVRAMLVLVPVLLMPVPTVVPLPMSVPMRVRLWVPVRIRVPRRVSALRRRSCRRLCLGFGRTRTGGTVAGRSRSGALRISLGLSLGLVLRR
ncbi:hypothetical protein EXIGLDRAFT_160910 [Exidia glandulosa HHB12029]|uniref:Uncharacterized protein n=1 Tax=Exidia glandulosa HHB12029 TaxID=1314781 RepID=A0A165FHE1_EXIGL|nr:hypothetical protein EXIGLDRAFT_160910 [Exidia glandulosa HHB12029]